jgi:hypothetical protein
VRAGRPRLLVGLVAGLAVSGGLAGAWAGGLILHDTSRPESIRDALAAFRRADPRPAGVDGVYVYATTGSESVSALGGAHHRYPGTTTITARRIACGFELRWNALQGRSTSWELCRGRAGLVLRRDTEAHRFFGFGDRTTYVCSGAVVRPAVAAAGRRWRYTCRSGKGVEDGAGEVVAASPELHVRTTGHVRSGDEGTEVVDWWFARGADVPARLALASRTSRKEFVGRVRYREVADLRLRSATPLR